MSAAFQNVTRKLKARIRCCSATSPKSVYTIRQAFCIISEIRNHLCIVAKAFALSRRIVSDGIAHHGVIRIASIFNNCYPNRFLRILKLGILVVRLRNEIIYCRLQCRNFSRGSLPGAATSIEGRRVGIDHRTILSRPAYMIVVGSPTLAPYSTSVFGYLSIFAIAYLNVIRLVRLCELLGMLVFAPRPKPPVIIRIYTTRGLNHVIGINSRIFIGVACHVLGHRAGHVQHEHDVERLIARRCRAHIRRRRQRREANEEVGVAILRNRIRLRALIIGESNIIGGNGLIRPHTTDVLRGIVPCEIPPGGHGVRVDRFRPAGSSPTRLNGKERGNCNRNRYNDGSKRRYNSITMSTPPQLFFTLNITCLPPTILHLTTFQLLLVLIRAYISGILCSFTLEVRPI